MVRYASLKTNFTYGELDPALQARPALTAYVNGADKMRNVLVIPQGGAIRRPGLEFICELPNVLAREDLSAATVLAPNGGTVANASDGDLDTVVTTTTNISTTDPYVLVEVDLISAKAIKFLDVYGLLTDGSTDSDGEVRWQCSDDAAAWTDIGNAFDKIDDTARTRRVEATGSHRYYRLVRIGGTDLGTQKFQFSEIELFQETATISAVRNIPFEFSTTQLYMAVATDRNLRIVFSDTYQTDIPIPHRSADLATLTWTQELDTLLLFHQDHDIRRILRQGANDEWNSDTWPTVNIPTNTFDNDTTGNELTITPDGNIGTSKTFTAAADIFTAEMAEDPPYHIVGIDGGRAKVTGFTSATVVTCEITEQYDETTVPGGEWFLQEPVWSETRGYPRAGTFFQGRLWLVGSRSLPSSGWASRSGDSTDFNTLKTSDSHAIEFEADTGDVAAFTAIYPGRHLQIFSSSSEFYIPVSESTTVTPQNIVLRRNSSRGAKEGIPVFEVDGATMFLQRGGKALREFLFVETEQAYSANNLSLLASHLVNDPIDMTLRRSTSTEEADYFFLVNTDGTLATFCTLRNQEVNGWTLCETQGDFRAVASLLEDSYFSVERTVDGTRRLFLEKFNTDMHVDSGVIGGIASSASLPHLVGASVGIRLDDLTQSDQVVPVDGVVDFVRESEVDYEAGLRFPDVTAGFPERDEYKSSGYEAFVRTMTVEAGLPEGTKLHHPKSLSRINVFAANTLGLYVNGQHVPTRSFGSGLLDAPGQPASEILEVRSSLGWSKEARISAGQKNAHPMTLYGIAYDVGV